MNNYITAVKWLKSALTITPSAHNQHFATVNTKYHFYTLNE